MKEPKFSFVATVKEREDGAPADYARYGAEVRDRLAETDIMLALILDNDEEQASFDPYNSAGE
jgi:phage terminase large subunit-like protein